MFEWPSDLNWGTAIAGAVVGMLVATLVNRYKRKHETVGRLEWGVSVTGVTRGRSSRKRWFLVLMPFLLLMLITGLFYINQQYSKSLAVKAAAWEHMQVYHYSRTISRMKVQLFYDALDDQIAQCEAHFRNYLDLKAKADPELLDAMVKEAKLGKIDDTTCKNPPAEYIELTSSTPLELL